MRDINLYLCFAVIVFQAFVIWRQAKIIDRKNAVMLMVADAIAKIVKESKAESPISK